MTNKNMLSRKIHMLSNEIPVTCYSLANLICSLLQIRFAYIDHKNAHNHLQDISHNN